jgi:uncharacterized membrane protein
MEWIQPYEAGLAAVAAVVKLILEFIAVLCVTLGLVAAAKLALSDLRSKDSRSFVKLRLAFGTWLALALEFQLAADILSTTIAPSLEELGQLAAIAMIRTFLNYFLRKELEAEESMQQRRKPTEAVG